MCYCNCPHERYPDGPNEGCHCRLPAGAQCPLDAYGPDDYQSAADKDDYEPEPLREWERELEDA